MVSFALGVPALFSKWNFDFGILCSFVMENLDLFCVLFNKAIRPAAINLVTDLQRVCADVCPNVF